MARRILVMWPAYLAALLLSLPVPPANGRDAATRSELDRSHLGEDVPQPSVRGAKAGSFEEDEEDEAQRGA